MAQQVQFVYLTQAEYDALETKDAARLYFTSDTGRIYRGTVSYAPQRVFYGTCSTTGSTATKVVTCPQFTSSDFVAGTKLIVKFTFMNSNTTPSITIGGSNKRIYRYGTTNPATYTWYNGQMVEFVYSGTYWLMVNPGPATTTYEGVVKLNDTLTSNSTTQAATANAVKQLNDKFDAALAEKRDYDDLSYTFALTDYPKNTFVVTNANVSNIDGEYTYTTPEQALVPGDGWYKGGSTGALWFTLSESTITALGPSAVELDASLAEQDVTMPIGDPSAPQGYLTFHLLRRVPNDSLALDSEKADISHAHGNITSDGALTADITIANGDKLVVTDASGSNKVARASLAFDGQTTTQYLSKKGTWQSLPTASTSASGVVQLNDTLTSTSTTQAATSNAVKQLNDKFDEYVSIADLENGLEVDDIEAKSITIDGVKPSLEGHTHTISDIEDYEDNIEGKIRYSLSSASTTTSGTTQTVELSDRANNSATQESGMTTVSLAFPTATSGKARDFILALTCGSTPPNVVFPAGVTIVVDDQTDLAAEEGTNLYSFTEISADTFVVSRLLVTAYSAQ